MPSHTIEHAQSKHEQNEEELHSHTPKDQELQSSM